MLRAVLVFLLALAAPFCQAQSPPWIMTMDEEFARSPTDPAMGSHWNVGSIGTPFDNKIHNGELQAYMSSAVSVTNDASGNGILHLTASKQNAVYGGQKLNYVSGLINTSGKFSQNGGRFVCSCRVPKGQGLWPAFWLLSQDQSWPPEIDVQEILGSDTQTAHFSYHYKDANGNAQQQAMAYNDSTDYSAAFHVFAIQWGAQHIQWLIDGTVRYTSSEPPPDTPMYVVLNLAVGGTWPGAPNAETVFPANFDVDWVRCYKAAPLPKGF